MMMRERLLLLVLVLLRQCREGKRERVDLRLLLLGDDRRRRRNGGNRGLAVGGSRRRRREQEPRRRGRRARSRRRRRRSSSSSSSSSSVSSASSTPTSVSSSSGLRGHVHGHCQLPAQHVVLGDAGPRRVFESRAPRRRVGERALELVDARAQRAHGLSGPGPDPPRGLAVGEAPGVGV